MEGLSIGGGKDRRKKFTAPVKTIAVSDNQAAEAKPEVQFSISHARSVKKNIL